jgi:hypothetical protein
VADSYGIKVSGVIGSDLEHLVDTVAEQERSNLSS